MKSNRGAEIAAFAAIFIVLAALVGWLAWPSLTDTDDEPDSLRAQILARIWPFERDHRPGVLIAPPPTYPTSPYPRGVWEEELLPFPEEELPPPTPADR